MAGLPRIVPLGIVLVGIFALPTVALETIDFTREIPADPLAELLSCHGPDEKKREAGLRLDVRESVVAAREGHRAIARGDPKLSELVRRISASDADERMPPPATGKRLIPQEIDRITPLDQAGAPYSPHWAYVRPVRPRSTGCS